jgi:hypothetical protein
MLYFFLLTAALIFTTVIFIYELTKAHASKDFEPFAFILFAVTLSFEATVWLKLFLGMVLTPTP